MPASSSATPFEPLLDVHDVAAWLNVHPSWVYEQARAGVLRPVVLGKKDYRWSPATIRTYLENARASTTS